jgi:hypothetical protein
MSGLEFEKKFVLDARHHEQIEAELARRMKDEPPYMASSIRQYYDKDGDRYRSMIQGGEISFVKEPKKSIKIGTDYAISIEATAEPVDRDFFEEGWKKNRARRLQKLRFTVPGRYPNHKIMVDFFFSSGPDPVAEFYAIVAEVETMLLPETETLYLNFQLPIYLERYCLCAVDDTDPAMKVFKSANMVDQPENIEAVKMAIRQLYE